MHLFHTFHLVELLFVCYFQLCGDNILDSSLEMDSTVKFEIGTMESKELDQDSFPSPQSSIVGDATEIAIQQPRTLQQEFSLVNMNIPNVTIEEVGYGCIATYAAYLLLCLITYISWVTWQIT